MDGTEVDSAIVTPAGPPAGFLARLLREQWLPGLAARIGVKLTGKPRRIGTRVIAGRHAHAVELLRRDEEFIIAPINDVKVREVNGGPFILGMDRSPQLDLERRALYAALDAVDLDRLRDGVSAGIDAALGAVPAGGEIDAIGAYARPIAAHTAQRLFGITGPNDATFMEAVRSVFGHTFLNIGNDPAIRDRAIRAGGLMGGWFADEIARRRASGEHGDDMMGQLMRQAQLDDDGVRRTLGGMLVGSIDTTATCVTKVLKVASRDRDLRRAMERDVGDVERMDGWCNEALRRWPHNPIVMRSAAADCTLAGAKVKRGDTVIAWTQAAMQDRSAFPRPREMDADRDRALYLHLGWGLHLCSGLRVNRFQIPMLVAGLLNRGLDRLGEIEWKGPFPDKMMARLAR
jgi:cytochrome P450